MDLKRLLTLAFSSLALTSVATAQTTYYVDASTCPAAGSGSQANPYCNIQTAINGASDGDVILVLPGTYTGSLNFNGRSVEVRSIGGPGLTRISGVVVRFVSGEGTAAIIDGFDIVGGFPGIECRNSSPQILNNVIRNCRNNLEGGGLRITNNASPIVRGNTIRNNAAWPGLGTGGGVFVDSSSPLFENNVIANNNAFADGGSLGAGVAVFNSTVTFAGNLFRENVGDDQYGNTGAGLYAKSSTLTLLGNTFVGNLAADATQSIGSPGVGGAIALVACVATIRDHISWGNIASDGPELAQPGVSGAIQVSYSDVEGGLPAVYGPTGVTFGPGMVDTDPLFVDATADDYHLLPASPLIDAGWPGEAATVLDGDGDPRNLDGTGNGVQRLDMGWDEFNRTLVVVSGLPVLGTSLTFQTLAPAGQLYGLAFSTESIAFLAPPFGTLLVNPASLVIVGVGGAPGIDAVAIPAIANLVGTRVHFQALARTPGLMVGSFSRRVDMTLR